MLYGTGIWLGGIANYLASAFSTYGIRSGSDSIAAGVNTKSILFSSNVSNTNYSISLTIINLVDGSPQTFQDLKVTVKAVGGFTFSLGDNTLSANNVADWSIQPHV